MYQGIRSFSFSEIFCVRTKWMISIFNHRIFNFQIAVIIGLVHFGELAFILIPPETIREPKVFRVFQGVSNI